MKRRLIIICTVLLILTITLFCLLVNRNGAVRNWGNRPIEKLYMTNIELSTKWEKDFMLLKIYIGYSNKDTIPGWFETEPVDFDKNNNRDIIFELIFLDKDGFEKLRYKILENKLETNKLLNFDNKLVGFEINDKIKIDRKDYLSLKDWKIRK